MAQIHEKYSYLLAGESPSGLHVDLVYPAHAIGEHAGSTLFVDYDLTRILRARPAEWRCCELEDVDGRFNRLLMWVNQYDSPDQIRRDVFAASRLVLPRGELRIAAPLKGGSNRVGPVVAQCFRSVLKVKSDEASLYLCRKPSPKEPPPETASLTYHDDLSDRELRFYTRPGMFSSANVDKGTDLLLRTAGPLEGASVLDVGCGYGAVGVVAAARGARVSLLDVDARAVKLAKRNLRLNGHDGDVRLAVQPYEFAADEYDAVLSNPPTHAGSETLQQLFGEMVRVSKPDGRVVIVVREHLNYEKWLVKLGRVTVIAKSAGYKIIQIEKEPRDESSGRTVR